MHFPLLFCNTEGTFFKKEEYIRLACDVMDDQSDSPSHIAKFKPKNEIVLHFL